MPDEIGIWRELEREQLDDCRVFTVHRSTRESPVDQSHHDFYLIHSSDWVNIVPLTDDNQVVCIRQFRHGTERIELEVPGGLVDPGEDAETAAASYSDGPGAHQSWSICQSVTLMVRSIVHHKHTPASKTTFPGSPSTMISPKSRVPES